MLLSFETTFAPVIELRIKIEINCKEHINILDFASLSFTVDNLWFSGECSILTYQLEELIGTKIRALYQRKKGRDLFDLAYACDRADLNLAQTIECYKRYIALPGQPPTHRKRVHSKP